PVRETARQRPATASALRRAFREGFSVPRRSAMELRKIPRWPGRKDSQTIRTQGDARLSRSRRGDRRRTRRQITKPPPRLIDEPQSSVPKTEPRYVQS